MPLQPGRDGVTPSARSHPEQSLGHCASPIRFPAKPSCPQTPRRRQQPASCRTGSPPAKYRIPTWASIACMPPFRSRHNAGLRFRQGSGRTAAREPAKHVVRRGLRKPWRRFQEHAPLGGLDGEPGSGTGGKGRRSRRLGRMSQDVCCMGPASQPDGRHGGSELGGKRASLPGLEGTAAMMLRRRLNSTSAWRIRDNGGGVGRGLRVRRNPAATRIVRSNQQVPSCGKWSKWRSEVHRTRSCWIASDAIQRSFVGMAAPLLRS